MSATRSSGGRRLLHLVLFVALVAVLGDLAWNAAAASRVEAERQAVEREAHRLYEALLRYHDRHGLFPNAVTEPRLDATSLEPLRRLGYYDGILLSKLDGRRLDAYDSPDDRGPNQEFWIELTPAVDGSVRYVVARSDDAPSAGGEWLDGVFRVRDGRVEPAS